MTQLCMMISHNWELNIMVIGIKGGVIDLRYVIAGLSIMADSTDESASFSFDTSRDPALMPARV